MTEKQIQLLGFEKQNEQGVQVSDGEGNFWIEDNYYYYTYDIAMGLALITNASDEVKQHDQWFVEVFNTEPAIRFTEFGEVQALINLLQSRIINDTNKTI